MKRAIKLKCPKGHVRFVDPDMAGKRAVCNECAYVFDIPTLKQVATDGAVPVRALKPLQLHETIDAPVIRPVRTRHAPVTPRTHKASRVVRGRGGGTAGSHVALGLIVAALIGVGGWVGYNEYNKYEAKEAVRSALQSLARANQAMWRIERDPRWESYRSEVITLFGSMNEYEQAGFLLTWPGAARDSARAHRDAPGFSSALARIDELERELRRRQKR